MRSPAKGRVFAESLKFRMTYDWQYLKRCDEKLSSIYRWRKAAVKKGSSVHKFVRLVQPDWMGCRLAILWIVACFGTTLGCSDVDGTFRTETFTLLTLANNAEIPTHEIRHDADASVMVFIPAGEFVMGIDGAPSESGESPTHQVYLDGFYIDKYEVTNAQYQRFMEATGTPAPDFWDDPMLNEPNQPVVAVTWHQAKAYCEWVGKRLPTEAEWEKAARGMDGRIYPWGNHFDWTYGNFSDGYLEDGHLDGFMGSSPVGHFPTDISPYGVYDLGGNALEWVADWHDPNYYAVSPHANPTGATTGIHKVLRGGAMDIGPKYSRSVYRNRLVPYLTNMAFGFRCAKSLN
jgi:formylglycine-generating enzyme required for sulfatase activity